MIQGLVDESRLCAWVDCARELALKLPESAINAFVRVNPEGSHALGQRQFCAFQLDAIRQALSAAVANLEHFWSIFNLEWPDVTSRVVVSFRRVLPLEGLLSVPYVTEPSAAAHEEALYHPEVVS